MIKKTEWNKIEPGLFGFPDGCVYVEVMYEDNKTQQKCSCDLHWDLYNKKEMPVTWRYLEN